MFFRWNPKAHAKRVTDIRTGTVEKVKISVGRAVSAKSRAKKSPRTFSRFKARPAMTCG